MSIFNNRFENGNTPLNETNLNEILDEIISIKNNIAQLKPEKGATGENGKDGASVWIKYNSSPVDQGATSTWSHGQNYIGILTATASEAPLTGYTWILFIDKESSYEEPQSKNLDELSWEDINILANSNASLFFNVGDEKSLTLKNGETVTMVIIGLDHDDLTAGGKAKITFGMKNLMKEGKAMDNVNAIYDELLSKLPQDLLSVLKLVDKKSCARDSSIITTPTKLFLLSEVELRGKLTFSFDHEGSQYAYYKGKNYTHYIKYFSGGTKATWWLRSVANNSSEYFCGVYSEGFAYAGNMKSFKGISFCFCI